MPLSSFALFTLLAAAPLATVNREPITGEQLRAEFSLRHGGQRSLAGEQECRAALEAAIDRRLLLQASRRLGFATDPAVLGPVKEFEQQTAAALLYRLEVTDRSQVTDADVREFLETRTADVFTVRQLVVKSKSEAEALRRDLLAGADFARLARQRSVGLSRWYGGLITDLGWGSRDPAWEAVAYNLERGALSEVLQTREGFEILRLEDKAKLPRAEGAQAEGRIRGMLAGRKSEARRAVFHQELWARYAVTEPKVDWTLDALKAAVGQRTPTVVATWTGGSLTLASFADRIDLEQVATLPPDYKERIEGLRHELVRREVVSLEVAARNLLKAREVVEPVEAYRGDLMVARYFDQQVMKGVAPTAAEVRRHYDSHRADFTRPERRRLRQIVVATEKKANDTLKKLESGAKFESLARTLSTDAESAAKDGDLGWVTSAETPHEFLPVLRLKVGEVSAPITSVYGVHLIKVVDIAPPAVPPFNEVADEVAAAVLGRKVEERTRAWVRKLRSQANISIDQEALKSLFAETGSPPASP